MALAKQAVLDHYMTALGDADKSRGKKQVEMTKLETQLDLRDAMGRIADALEYMNKHNDNHHAN